MTLNLRRDFYGPPETLPPLAIGRKSVCGAVLQDISAGMDGLSKMRLVRLEQSQHGEIFAKAY